MRSRSSPPWIFYAMGAAFLATGLFYLFLGIRAKSRGYYAVQIPAPIGMILGNRRREVSPGVAIALGILGVVGAGLIVFFGYASANPFGFG